jgi:hypothetical protein
VAVDLAADLLDPAAVDLIVEVDAGRDEQAFGPSTIVRSSSTATISWCSSMTSSRRLRSSGRAAEPISRCLASRPIAIATVTRRRPIRTDASGSQKVAPVISLRAISIVATAMPMRAALSSKRTIFTFGSRLSLA